MKKFFGILLALVLLISLGIVASAEGEAPSILNGTPFEALGKTLGDLRDNKPTQVYARLPYDIQIR